MALPEADKRPLSEFLYELRRVRSVLGRAEERLGDVIDGLDGGGSGLPFRRESGTARKYCRTYAGDAARQAAAGGVGSVTLRAKDARTVFVSIDRGPEFALSRALADLLAVLSSADEVAPDGLVAFQSLEKVMSRVAAGGRRCSRRAVIVGISRLRARLQEHNYPPLLVETSRRVGVRFRLRNLCR
jgi:DNA-binding response OmpR family regulator